MKISQTKGWWINNMESMIIPNLESPPAVIVSRLFEQSSLHIQALLYRQCIPVFRSDFGSWSEMLILMHISRNLFYLTYNSSSLVLRIYNPVAYLTKCLTDSYFASNPSISKSSKYSSILSLSGRQFSSVQNRWHVL